MTSPKLSLLPAGHDDRPPLLSTLELVSGGEPEFLQCRRAKIGQGMTFEPSPQVLYRVAVRRVRRQKRDLNRAIGRVQILAHHAAAMGSQTIPDDQQLALEMVL